jgi:tripartite-type tricarboxylate transporter receptor subunit TctC
MTLNPLKALAILCLGAVVAAPAWSQTYPERPVRIVVPFAAGSATDIVTRLIADELREALGQPFVVDNRPGGSAQIGAEAVARAAPDGYTLFSTTNTSHSANPHLFKKLNYDPIKDFAPIASIMRIPVVIVIDPKLGIDTLQQLVDHGKANPGKLAFGYGNSIGQVVGASFARRTGIDVKVVSYKSTPQVIQDILGGHIHYGVSDLASGQSFIRSGQLRPLGVSSRSRSAVLPEVQAMSEVAGLENFEVIAWVAMFAPAGTPQPIIDRLNGVVVKALEKPHVRERISGYAADVAPSSPQELGTFVASQLDSWGQAIREAGIEPQ